MKDVTKGWILESPISFNFVLLCTAIMLLPLELKQSRLIIPSIPGDLFSYSDPLSIILDRIRSSDIFMYLITGITANLCHSSFSHYFYNMIPILVLGPVIEHKLSKRNMIMMILSIMMISSLLVISTIRYSFQGSSTVGFDYYGAYLTIMFIDNSHKKMIGLTVAAICIPIGLWYLHVKQMLMIEQMYL